MREEKFIELKENITTTFLKTVSAYANFGEGVVYFGVSDNGEPVGLSDPVDACLRIENMINDNINPHPDFTLEVNERLRTVKLTVEAGDNKPYLFKGKAYKRNDTSTIPVDRYELSRLAMIGLNVSYDSTLATRQELTFELLTKKMKSILHVETVNLDVFKTLGLYTEKQGYTVAAQLFSDENETRGIDIAKFGESINIINERIDLSNHSLLEQYDQALEVYRRYYQYEIIQGAYRQTVELIPQEAFREAITNALVHRDWGVQASIRVAMYDEYVEITSPGSLPPQVKVNDYLNGNVSYLRNPIIGNIFFRLHIIESFGTRITRIKQSYKHSMIKPSFDVSESCVRIILPVIAHPDKNNESKINLVKQLGNKILSSSEIARMLNLSKTKTVYLLNELLDDGSIEKVGSGRSTKYYNKR